jgi:octaprenyl-diphosphate synthase
VNERTAVAAPGGRQAAPDLASLTAPVRDEMERAETLLRALLDSPHPFLRAVAGHMERFRGKRLRPAILLLSARAWGNGSDLACELAAIVETIHLASLCHDDVLDGAELRRAAPTLNAQWGTQTAVMTGDLLLSRAFERLAQFGDLRLVQALGQVGRMICEGELLQIGSRFNPGLRESDYLALAEKKTGALFGAAARLGVLAAGAGEADAERMGAFGRHLGCAFQIVDDCLDVTGVEASAGKSLGADLRNGELTLPVIHLLRTAEPARRTELLELLQAGHAERRHHRLRALVASSDAVSYALGVARRELHSARQLILFLPPTAAREALLGFPEYILARSGSAE